jgi:acylphosphatase
MRLHAVVQGRVQGVGFRWFVREAAIRLDLAGWVRNDPNGSVVVEAEGSTESIDAFRRELERGPRGALVESLQEHPSTDAPLQRPFTIVR